MRTFALAAVPLALLLAGCKAAPAMPAATQVATMPSRSGHATAVTAAPGRFDYYVLNLSWSPEYCYNHRGAEQCRAQSRFVLHGLWPQNQDGTYPSACDGATLPDGMVAPYPDARLANHEWSTHGTCTGLNPQQYFAEAGQAFHSIAIPEPFTTMTSTIVTTPDAIAGMFRSANPSLPASSIAVSCRSGYLTEVEVCLDKNLHGIACGQGISQCTDAHIKVPAPRPPYQYD